MNESFCSPGELAYRRNLAKRRTRLFIGLLAGMILLFALVCLMTRTGNARQMTILLFAVMIPLGCAAIGYYCLAVYPARARVRHLEGLAARTPEIREGLFYLSPSSFPVPHSVRVHPVTLKSAGEGIRLNLDECRAGTVPEDGTPVRVQTAGRFITAIESPDGSPLTPRSSPPRRKTRWIRRLAALLPWFILWAFCFVLFGGFVMNQITDAPAAQKLTIYVDGEVRDAVHLAEKLEESLKGSIRMVKVHPFSYALFGTDALKSADLYLVPASDAETYADWFAPLPDRWQNHPDAWRRDGTAYGLPLQNGDGHRPLSAYLPESQETWYLFFGARSPHLAENPGAVDNLAVTAAELLPAMN